MKPIEMNLQLTDTEINALNSVADKCHQLAISNGWYDKPETTIELLARHCTNIHGEVSELWEAARKNQLEEPCDKSADMIREDILPINCLEEESADILIRVFDLCGKFETNIGTAVARKHAYNATREARHGGKLA